MSLIDPNTLPYRTGVGIVLLNAQSLIWIGRRCERLEPEEVVNRWQMPQGGIDEAEDPQVAALRELHEETGIRSVEILAQSKDWISYDLPPAAVGRGLRGKYRGQRQKWFAMRFIGREEEINLRPDGHTAEFDAWCWATEREVLTRIVDFKRPAYDAVFAEFAHLIAP